MFDMLPALAALTGDDRRFLLTDAARNPRAILSPPIEPSSDRVSALGPGAFSRVVFAVTVIDRREIEDFGIPEDQVNDGREFLGCTRLDDDGVQQKINEALNTARGQLTTETCCNAIRHAWASVLVKQRRMVVGGKPASLIANLAAAAHYMLSRYHVCDAKVFPSRMKIIIDGYDADKRLTIAAGDSKMKSVGLTSNPPFPPDFGIRRWAYKGADEGEGDRMRCNSKTWPSFPGQVTTEYF